MRRSLILFLITAGCAGESPPAVDTSVAATTPRPDSVATRGGTAAPGGRPGGAALAALPHFGTARPVDEASRNPSVVAFRDTLLGIATRRDSAALHARLHPTIKFSFGGSQGGPAAFFAHWNRFHSMDRLWIVMKDILEHGGRLADDKTFRAPWTFEALPDSLDAFEYVVVRDSGAVAWPAADSSQAPVGTLSYAIVRAVHTPRPDSVWRPVKLRDGRTVYVAARHIRSPLDWRIGMRQSGNRWMIHFFVAGD